jgi:hypothetical protein
MRDTINDRYEELMAESIEGDKLAMKLKKQFDKMIVAEIDKKFKVGIEKDRLTQWVQWKIAREWGR